MAQDLTKFADAIVAGMRDYVARNLAPIVDRIKALSDRIDAMPVPERGEKGMDGAPGRDGVDGAPGKDADVDVIRDLVARAFAALPVPKDGAPGKDGRDGIDGKDGTAGRDGVDGTKGDPGADGRDGRDGEPGRDAVHVDVLDGIDPTKRYGRGTWATHDGGVVRAYRATEPMAEGGDIEKHGWHVVLRGLTNVEVDVHDDLRTMTVRHILTGGKVRTKSVAMPVVIYRGIWTEADTYTRGDSTTRDGSTWILMTERQAGKPGDAESGWQLSTKRGRDGRDGIKGEKGERGSQGKDGALLRA